MNLMTLSIIIFGMNLILLSLVIYSSFRKISPGHSDEAPTAIPREIIERFGISQREKEIALSILEGKTNGEIAEEKLISVTTVKKHVYNLFQKTNSRNRVEFINRLRKAM